MTAADGTETVRRYVYDGEDIRFELDGEDRLLSEFVHGPGIDEPLVLKRAGRTYHYHADALSSIVAITDDEGRLVQRYTYSSYGEITSRLEPEFEQPYGFTGREYDAESGLYRARYYDPAAGRFLTRDPIGLADGVNLYAYVEDNPVNAIDPFGLATTALALADRSSKQLRVLQHREVLVSIQVVKYACNSLLAVA